MILAIIQQFVTENDAIVKMVKNNYNFVGKKSKTNYLKVQRQKRKNTKK